MNVFDSTWNAVGELLGFTDPYTMCVDTAKDVYVTDFSEKRVTECPQGAITSTRILADREGTPIHYLRLNRLFFKSEPRCWALRRKLTTSGAFYAVQAARDDQVRSQERTYLTSYPMGRLYR